MAWISEFSINSVGIDRINFNYGYEANVYDNYQEGGTFRTESEYSWKFSTTGGSSTYSPCLYKKGGSGQTLYSLEAELTYKYSEGYYDWSLYSQKSYYGRLYVPDDEYGEDYQIIYEIDDYWIEEDEIYYDYTRYYYILEEFYWEENVYETIEKSLNFYPHSSDFIFNNCSVDKQWNINEGISSLITNIEDFYQSAQQWKSWKYQSAATTCPSFTDAEGYLAASSLNSVYNYVGLGMPWKSGDYISAAMFNDLAEQINE